LFHASAWPIAAKLSLVLVVVSLVPMAVTAMLDVRHARVTASRAEHEGLERLAESGAARIDQLLADTRRAAAIVAGDAEVVAFLAEGKERDSAALTIANVTLSNEDVAHTFLLDARGVCVLTTRAEELGIDYAHRAYFQEAKQSGRYVSEILTGVTSKKPGVYFANAVVNPARGFVGVAVVKLSGEVIGRMTSAIHPEDGGAILVDAWGVVIASTQPSLLYKSLTPLAPDVLASPAFENRFTSVGVTRIESLELSALAKELVRPPGPGFADTTLPGAGSELVGFAPVSIKPWTLAVYEPEAKLEAPFARVTRRASVNALVVGIAALSLALLLARTIVRPVRRLTEAARALRRGDFGAVRLPTEQPDEIGTLADAFNRMARGLAERERERDIFGRMVSPEVREKLLSGNLELGGETRRAVVLFSDIRGFSTLSEKMDPQAVVALLNEYLTEMTAATAAFNGYINNFIGDAIVVIFGAPIPQPDADRRAVAAALAMRDALGALNVRRAARGEAAIETGIGIAAGDMVAGQIGSPERMLYTVIGDAVNVAARLEALTKEYPGKHVLVTRAVADAVGDAVTQTESLGHIRLKGRTEPVDVVAVIC
jgi:class 3 adenylate cyclase